MKKLDFSKNNVRIKLIETADELYQARRLRYEELILLHRDAKDIKFEDSYDAWDEYCDHLIAVDETNGQVVGCYRLIMRKHLEKTGGFAMESNFNVEDIKNLPKEILEMGRAAVKEGYRDGFVIKMLFAGLFKYIELNGVEFLFGVISLPEMEEKVFNNLMGYFYTMASKDPQIQPFGKEPSFSLDLIDDSELDIQQAKRNVPAVLKAYIAMGCSFASTGNMQNRLLRTKDVLVMMDMKKINKRYMEFITR